MLPIGSIIRLVMVLIIVSIVAGGFYYVTGLRADLAVSEINNQKMLEAVDLQQAAIQQMRVEQEAIRAANEELANTVRSANRDMSALKDRFTTNADGTARDIGQLAMAKPASIERAINRGTSNALRCIEIASGAPLTDTERRANTPSEINKECPSIANPNYRPAGQ
jgi:hypothetical protein